MLTAATVITISRYSKSTFGAAFNQNFDEK